MSSDLSDKELDEAVAREMMGWVSMPTSCRCGGRVAWLKPRPSGALEMVGCVCHFTPKFSSDARDAERVWTWLNERGWRCSIFDWSIYRREDTETEAFEAHAEKPKDDCGECGTNQTERITKGATTYKRALCLAALAVARKERT